MGDPIERMSMSGGGGVEALLAEIEILTDAAFQAGPADGHQIAVVAQDPCVGRRHTRLAHV